MALVPICLAACTSSPPTYSVSGSLMLQAGPAPSAPDGWETTLDTVDTIAYTLTDTATGAQLKSGPLTVGAFDLTGIPPGDYTLEIQAQHHQFLTDDIEVLGTSTTDVPVSGATDLGEVVLPYAQEY